MARARASPRDSLLLGLGLFRVSCIISGVNKILQQCVGVLSKE